MTAPRTTRDMMRYLLKRSWKVFFRKLATLLYIDKRYLKMATLSGISYGKGTRVRGGAERIVPLARMKFLLISIPNDHMNKLAREKLCS